LGHSLCALLARSLVVAVALSAYLVAVIALSAIGIGGHIDLIYDFCPVYAAL